MSDLVIVELVKTAFWLILFAVGVTVFRHEIRHVVRSLGSVNVAGATFQLKDKTATLQSYVLLSETLIDMLSRSDRVEDVRRILSPSQIEKLGAFALTYTDEVGDGQWNEELLRNIAYLLIRFARPTQAVKLYDALLVRRPHNIDLLNLKALALMTSRLEGDVREAEAILSSLVARYPEFHAIRFNYALSKSLLGDQDEVERQLQRLVESGYSQPDFLDDPLLHRTRADRPDLIERMREALAARSQQNQP